MGALREAVAAAMGRLEAADPAGEAVLTADLGELEVRYSLNIHTT